MSVWLLKTEWHVNLLNNDKNQVNNQLSETFVCTRMFNFDSKLLIAFFFILLWFDAICLALVC